MLSWISCCSHFTDQETEVKAMGVLSVRSGVWGPACDGWAVSLITTELPRPYAPPQRSSQPAPCPCLGPSPQGDGAVLCPLNQKQSWVGLLLQLLVCVWHWLPGVCKAFRRWGYNLPSDHPPCRPQLQTWGSPGYLRFWLLVSTTSRAPTAPSG